MAGLVAGLLTDMAEQSLPRTETGSLLGDLRANAELVRSTLADPRQGALFKAVIAAATTDPRTAESLHRFYEIRVAEWAPCVEQAVRRGELPEGTDPHEVIRAVSAPLYYRLLTSDAPLDRAAGTRAAEAAAAAARAGGRLHVRRGGSGPGAGAPRTDLTAGGLYGLQKRRQSAVNRRYVS